MAKEEENSGPVTTKSAQPRAIKSKNDHKNRVEFRLHNDELWIYESVAKFLFENGYIRNPTLSEAARFSLRLYARDYVTQGHLLTKKLSEVIPITYYDKLVKERDSEKQLRMLYEAANETFVSLSKAQSQTIDNSTTGMRPEEEESHQYGIPEAREASPTKVQSRDKTLKGQFFYIPGLMARKTAWDYKGYLENGQA